MMVIYLPASLNSIGQTIWKQKGGQTDRQMDVEHINLIGWLVTSNPHSQCDWSENIFSGLWLGWLVFHNYNFFFEKNII